MNSEERKAVRPDSVDNMDFDVGAGPGADVPPEVLAEARKAGEQSE